MRGPIDVTQALLAAGVAYEIVHLRRRIDDAAELPEVLGVPSYACLAVRLYDTDSRPVAALVPADRRAATTAIAKATRTRGLHETGPARVSELTEFNPSLVPPFCLPDDVLTVADEALRGSDVVYTATGDGSTALKVHTDDLFAMTGARVARLVEPGAEPATRGADDAWRGAVPQVATSMRR